MRLANRRGRGACSLFTALALGLLLLASSGCAPKQSIDRVRVDATVDGLGTLDATEARTLVALPGKAVEWQYTFRVGAVFEVLGVSGKGGEYALSKDASKEQSGTYTVTGDDDEVHIVAFPESSDTEQTLTLHYRVQGAALRWHDTSEFSWFFMSDHEKLPAGSVRIHIELPGELRSEDVRAWANGPLYSGTTVNGDGSIDIVANDLPAKTGLEARTLFPSDALPKRAVSPWSRADDVLEYEKDIALQVKTARFLDRARRAMGWTLGILVPVLALGYTLAYRWRHRTEFQPAFQGTYYREAPEGIMPAMASPLTGTVIPAANVVAATIADLIDRGVLTLTCPSLDLAACRLTRSENGADEVTRSEEYLLAALLGGPVNADGLTASDLRQRLAALDESGVRSTFQQRVRDELVMRRYLEHRVTGAGNAILLLAVVLLGIGLIAVAMTESPFAIAPALIVAPAEAYLALKMRKVTQPADDLAGKLDGVHNYLRDLSELEEPLPDDPGRWRRLLSLAVLFGVTEGVVATIRERLPEVADQIETERWLWASELAADLNAEPLPPSPSA